MGPAPPRRRRVEGSKVLVRYDRGGDPYQKEFFLVRLPESEMRKVEAIQRLREEMYDAGIVMTIGTPPARSGGI